MLNAIDPGAAQLIRTVAAAIQPGASMASPIDNPGGYGGYAAPPPLFKAEGPQFYQRAFQHNQAFAKAGPYQTTLNPAQEQRFRQWLVANRVPFDPNAKIVDYDMRGYYAANPTATHQQGQHFPDTFKTPYDTTFSGESKYAKPGTPFVWRGNNLVDLRTNRVIF